MKVAALAALALAGCTVSGAATPPPRTSPAPATTTSSPLSATNRPASTSATSSGWACTATLGKSCGAYAYPRIPNSNGYNTYVSNQPVGAQHGTTQTAHVKSPGNWELIAHDVPLGYLGVQTFPDVQQLFNNWCGTGWDGCPSPTNTPLASLSTLKVTYSETSPTTANSIYEFAVDVWSDHYGSDVMFWTDTHGRCDEGAFGGTTLGHAVLDQQHWTVHRYGGPGAEIIFVLDGTGGGPGKCAQQQSGTVNVKAGFEWLTANGFVRGPQAISQLNTGWEITSADDTTFRVHSYSIHAVRS